MPCGLFGTLRGSFFSTLEAVLGSAEAVRARPLREKMHTTVCTLLLIFCLPCGCKFSDARKDYSDLATAALGPAYASLAQRPGQNSGATACRWCQFSIVPVLGQFAGTGIGQDCVSKCNIRVHLTLH